MIKITEASMWVIIKIFLQKRHEVPSLSVLSPRLNTLG